MHSVENFIFRDFLVILAPNDDSKLLKLNIFHIKYSFRLLILRCTAWYKPSTRFAHIAWHDGERGAVKEREREGDRIEEKSEKEKEKEEGVGGRDREEGGLRG